MAQTDEEEWNDDHEEMEEEEDDSEGESYFDESEEDNGSENEEDEAECHYFIDTLRAIESATPLSQLLLSSRGQEDNSSGVLSLKIQTLVSIIDADLSGKSSKNEPEDVKIETCSYLITLLQGVYRKKEQGEGLVADPKGMDALIRAFSARSKSLQPQKRYKIDGCPDVLVPPNTSDQVQPSTVVKEVQDHLKMLKTVKEIRARVMEEEKKSVDELREGSHDGSFLDDALVQLWWDYSFEECLDGFSHPSKEDCDVYELIDDYMNFRDCTGQVSENTRQFRNRATVCLFAGVVLALKDLRDHRENEEHNASEGDDTAGLGNERDSDGHLIYEDEEPEMYHGWSGSWAINDDRLGKNDIFYGVKFGTILHFVRQQAKKMVKKSPSGSKYSLPRAKFVEDVTHDEGARSKEENEPATPHDFAICRATHGYMDHDVFSGDTDCIYSSWEWVHDGNIGFFHTGAGWKNREFFGHLYGFDLDSDGRSLNDRELLHEFWSTPSSLHADGTNNLVWVQADRRIKGFSTDSWNSSFIFSLEKNPRKEAAGVSKRQKVSEFREEGTKNIIVFGTERVGYLKCGVIQEWNLSEANRHDGVRRMVSMNNIRGDLSQWNEHEVINCSEETSMDDTGAAEASAGVKPDSIRIVDIDVPSSLGYLPNGLLAFAHLGTSHIPIYDQDLRQVSQLFWFREDRIEIVQRPTFEKIGEGHTFVASDQSCVKVFDLRSGKAEATIQQKCVSSEPIIFSGAKFVCNRLRRGKGAMMWDLRSQKPLYSLPISADTDIAWVPTLDGTSKPPILMTSKGDCYKYGLDFPQNDWEHSIAKKAWSQLEKNPYD